MTTHESSRASVASSEVWQSFRAAALLGLISSTFSTIATTLAAARIGQHPITDWMVVAASPSAIRCCRRSLRPGSSQRESPSKNGADFSWAVVFFGVFGRWTARLAPFPILLIGLA
ncbi:MAG: hypothetical protein QOH65_1569 [Methylobacteriaceae bacterium]|nr:hypothetical protein [Methylobacteriaceae bacterium]